MNEMTEFFFIGYVGEKNARRKPIDITDLLMRWPDATPVLMVNRPKEEAPYPATTTQEDAVLYWEVSEVDVVKSGYGQAQVYMRDANGQLLGKSEVINTLIKNTLNGAEQENPPTAVEAWVTKLLNASEEMKSGYVKKAQGTEYAGMVLGVGSDGVVAPVMYGGDPGSGGGVSINDNVISTTTTYSSSKIDELLSEQKEAIDNKVSTDQLNTAVEAALTEAKNSGEFKGDKGDKPEKGTDYWTAADKQEIVSDVLAALPNASGVNF